MIDLKDKVSIITGAGQGIGREIALALSRAGACVSAADYVEQGVKSLVEELTASGTEAIYTVADVSKFDHCRSIVDNTIKKFGRIDILVNNAGITRDNLLVRMKEEEWQQVLDVNLKGTFNCTKAAARPMLKQRSGRIINIASIIGLTGNAGQANYSASKAGVIALTKSTAKEFASRGITANAIAPGYIDTAMTKALKKETRERMLSLVLLARMGTATDVANAVLFLAGDLAAYITGEVIRVDGGLVM